MSPEQILDQPQDARADLFALGCVLYQCLTGARAFAGGPSRPVSAESDPRVRRSRSARRSVAC